MSKIKAFKEVVEIAKKISPYFRNPPKPDAGDVECFNFAQKNINFDDLSIGSKITNSSYFKPDKAKNIGK